MPYTTFEKPIYGTITFDEICFDFATRDAIVDYKIINEKVVIFTFDDGTTETTVCDDQDVFDLNRAAELAVMKHKLGSTEYNRLVSHAVKDIKAIDKQREKDKLEKEAAELRYEKNVARKIARKQRREEAERQSRINEMAEAYVKAMTMVSNKNTN